VSRPETHSMIPEPVVVIDRSEILEGKLPEVETVIKEMAAFVESNEPRPISYNVYLNQDRTRMTVVQVHPDSASMEHHMKVAAPTFAKFEGLIRLARWMSTASRAMSCWSRCGGRFGCWATRR